MLLSDGGGKAKKIYYMRPTFYGSNNTVQLMIFPDDYENIALRGKPKGMKTVLIERGLWREKLSADCKLCKEKVIDDNRIDCCARRIISLQPDFIGQKGLLEEIVEKAGHKIIFYPKFHCELNFIERYLGAVKRHTRLNCNYSWSGLQTAVPVALDSVDVIKIRRFARKSFRYMDAYRKGLTGHLAEYAVQKYKSHRRIPQSVLDELDKMDNNNNK